jgi:hypothetical protein
MQAAQLWWPIDGARHGEVVQFARRIRLHSAAGRRWVRSLSMRLLRGRRLGIVLSDHTDEDGTTIFLQACKMGLEGIVSKRLGAPYRSGPSRDWLPYPASNHPYHKLGSRGQDAARRGRGQGAVGGDAADAGLQLPGDRCQKHRWLSPAERTRRTNDRGPRD